MGDFDWEPVRRAYLDGDFASARKLLEGTPAPESVLWHARLNLRDGREVEAVDELLRLAPLEPRFAAERDALLANAYANTGEFAMAHRLLDRALPQLKPHAEAYYRGVYTRCLAYFLEGRYDDDERSVDELIRAPHPRDRAHGFTHRSWIAARREDVDAQLRDLVHALDEYDRCEEPDQYSLSRSLVTLAGLCRELPVNGLVERLQSAAARVLATDATVFQRFQLARTLGWIDALRGDEMSALRHWRAAQAGAPSEYWFVFCLADRAYYAAEMGRGAIAGDALAEAHRLASRLSWETTRDEERIILLTLAQLFAARDPALAQRYIAQFRSLKPNMDPRMGWVGDRRTRALEIYPHGIALLRLGEREAALAMLEEAWTIFTAFRYQWRAARAALDLYGTTGERVWLNRAREQIAPWPQSWIARDVRNAG